MKRIRRGPFLIGAAVILPLIIFLGFQLAFSARDQRMIARAEVLDKTERILVEADGALQRTLGALDLLSTTPPVTNGDWPELYEPAGPGSRLNPGLVTVRLTDVAQRRELFDLSCPFGAAVPADGFAVPPRRAPVPSPSSATWAAAARAAPARWSTASSIATARPAYLITVALDTRSSTGSSLQQVEPGGVERHGRPQRQFRRPLDRSPAAVGTPATSYVQEAIRRGRSGIYSADLGGLRQLYRLQHVRR